MTRLRVAPMLMASIVGVASAKMMGFGDQARDPGIESWIGYHVLGPINSPHTPLYLTTQPYKPWLGEPQVVLSPAKYDTVSSYTQARIAHSDCPGDKALINDWYTVQIAEHGKGHTQQCMLPQRLACDYLSGVANLRGINWTPKELRLITGFMSQAQCKILITGH